MKVIPLCAFVSDHNSFLRFSAFFVTLSPLLCFFFSVFVSLSPSASWSPFSLCPYLLLSNSLSRFHCLLISLYLLYFIVYFSMLLHLHLSTSLDTFVLHSIFLYTHFIQHLSVCFLSTYIYLYVCFSLCPSIYLAV